MGFLQTIPATTLTASYLTKSQTLRLEAKGDAQNYTGGIAFHRMPWAGGLLFKLEGWVGPVAMGWTPYDIVNDFKMDLPNPVMPSNIVLIDTLEGRKEVPIVFEPPLAKNGTNGTNGNGLSARVEAQSQPPESKALDGQKLTVLYKEPFNISEGINTSDMGSDVTISFDKTFLDLTTAGVQTNSSGGGKLVTEIIWTFNSLQTGKTQIAVTYGGGIMPFIMTKKYDVTIEVLEAASTTATTSSTTTNGTSNGDHKTTEVPLSWLGFVNIGINLIQKAAGANESVVLLEADATPTDNQPVSSYWGLNALRVVCRVGANKTGIVQSTGWGEFGPVQISPQPWLEDMDIAWPMSPEMGMDEAWDILNKSGYNGLVDQCTLRQPVYPGMDQAFFIFGGSGGFWAVGVKDKKARQFSANGRVLAA